MTAWSGTYNAADRRTTPMVTDEGASFGALVRQHRLAAGLTQEMLATRAGLSVRGVSDLERGARRAPYPDTVRRLADALGLPEAARSALAAASRQATDRAPASPAPSSPASSLPA